MNRPFAVALHRTRVDVDCPRIRVEGGLQPQGLLGREETGIGELDIPELAADGAECLAARREGQLQIGRRGHDRRMLHAVVGEVGRQAQVEPRLPGGPRPALRDPEQRVGRRRRRDTRDSSASCQNRSRCQG